MTAWVIKKEFQNTAVAKVFLDIDKVFELEGEIVSKNSLSNVIKLNIDGRTFYVKRYVKAGENFFKRYLRSQVQVEWENLELFEHFGIPTANVVAFGEEKKYGVFKRGALITEEIKNTVDLVGLASSKDKLLSNKVWLNQVMEKVADYTAKLHQAGFVHNDLNWRNILVTKSDIPNVYFIDCANGKHSIQLGQGIIKDLSSLDKCAKIVLTKKNRLRFYHYYFGIKKLSKRNKQQVRKVIQFF